MLDLTDQSSVDSFVRSIVMSEGERIADYFLRRVDALRDEGTVEIDGADLLGRILDEVEPGLNQAWHEAGELAVYASLTGGNRDNADQSR